METELTALLEQIRREGADKARAQAQEILDEARRQAEAIVREAEEKAARAQQQALEEIAKHERSSRTALTQAARDLLLQLQKRLLSMMDAILQSAVTTALSPELVQRLVIQAVENWRPDSLRIELPPQDVRELEQALRSALREKVVQGVEITASDRLSRGFRLGSKDGNLYYDFSPQAIAEVLAQAVNPELEQLLRQAAE